MNKQVNLLLTIIAFTLTACDRGNFYGDDENIITIRATLADESTKTIIQNGSTAVLWEPGDAVKVFYKTTGSRFTSNNTEPVGTADFTGTLSVSGFFGEGFTTDTPLWAVYPFRSDATSDGNSITTTLPDQQIARAGSFATGTHITLAKSSNTTMGFYNVCGGVRFSVTHANVKEVVFSGRNEENIAGRVKLAFADGFPVVREVVEGQKSITVTAPDNGTFELGKWYYIVALPGTLSNGFKMTFSTDTQSATLDSPGFRTISRGIFGSLSEADKGLVYEDTGPVVSGNIEFADMAAKYACVEKFDTDGDGEVSIKEAEAATSFSGLFADWKAVEHFDEIRYFRNVHNISGVFSGCDKLVSITLPENITDLGTNAFSGCSSLSSIVLPGSISCIGRETFQGCSSLGSIIIPSGVISINEDAFIDCSKLTTVELPLGLSSISQRAFMNCSSLCSVNFPSSLKSIGGAAFYGCSSLASVDLPNQLTSIDIQAFSNCSSLASVALSENIRVIPDCCFQNCTALNNITLPAALTTIGSKAFVGCCFEESGSSLHIPASVTSIGSGAFEGVRHLILHSNSPVSIAPDSFAVGYTVFYVPSNLVEMLKVRTNWSNYADRIRPISDYPLATIPTPGTVGEPVDLGLSVKWASWNVGASAPEEIGSGFAWGETEIDWYYDWKHYKWFDGVGDFHVDKLSKYNSSDGKTVLDLEDDAAHINWGGTWRMPTKAEWQELLSNCSCEIIMLNGTEVYKYTGSNGNSIVIPDAGPGLHYDTLGRGLGIGYYWSSSIGKSVSTAYYVSFSYYVHSPDFGYDDPRYYGYLIRPVTE